MRIARKNTSSVLMYGRGGGSGRENCRNVKTPPECLNASLNGQSVKEVRKGGREEEIPEWIITHSAFCCKEAAKRVCTGKQPAVPLASPQWVFMLRGFCRAIFYDRLCAISHSVANMSYPLTKTETQALTRFPAFTDGCIYRRIGEDRKCRKDGEVRKRVICKYGGPLSLSGLQSIQHTHTQPTSFFPSNFHIGNSIEQLLFDSEKDKASQGGWAKAWG